MSTPTIQVLVGFEQTTGFATPFQLNNSTYGLLNTGRLGGIQMLDVTSMVRNITITRGRNRDTEQFNAGTASVVFYDPTRQLDPLNESSIYYPFVGPRQPIEIYASGRPIYTGTITDWDLNYDYVEAGNVVTAQCADNFTILANMTFAAWAPVEQLSGARITASLARPEVAYQGPRVLDTGNSTLGGTPGGGSQFDVDDGVNVLSYLQRISASEGGFLYMDHTNALAFVDRRRNINPASLASFTDDGTGIPYQSLTNQFGDELLYNSVQMQAPGQNVQVASDSTSIARYQASIYSKLDLLNKAPTEVLDLARAFLAIHKDPVLRFTGVDLQLAALTASDQDTVLELDLVDIVTVQKSFSVGTPASVSEPLIVSGISHTIRPGDHRVKLTFEHLDSRSYFTLNNDPLGKLDQNFLAF
jgi:hypothetical protein